MIFRQNVEVRVPTNNALEATLPKVSTLNGKRVKAVFISELTIDSKGGAATNTPFYLILRTKDKKDVITLTKQQLTRDGNQFIELDIEGFDPESSIVRFQTAPGANTNLVLLFFYE